MSSQKEKYLSSAQRFLLKGQLDRAIRDYEQVVSLDPNDVRHRQKLAELQVRANRREEALREYEEIGKLYDKNGFYLKAIAVFKQIQKLDPRNLDVYYTLAALNEKQGLIGNALAEYKTLVDAYEKSGQTGDVLKVLEKMLAADPGNLNVHLKLAETHVALGLLTTAYEEYTKVALALRERGEERLFDRICQRIASLFPDRADFMLDILAGQVKKGEPAVIDQLEERLAADPGNLRILNLLADAYRHNGDGEARRKVLRRIIALVPDDTAPRTALVESCMADGNPELALKLLKEQHSAFIAQGMGGALEDMYNALQLLLPGDRLVLEGLRAIYEATGDRDKLDAILAKLGDTGTEPAEPQMEPLAGGLESEESAGLMDSGELRLDLAEEQGGIAPDLPTGPSAQETGMAAEEPPARELESPSEEPPADFLWEEEIELSFPDEQPLDAAAVAPPAVDSSGDSGPLLDIGGHPPGPAGPSSILAESFPSSPAMAGGLVEVEVELAEPLHIQEPAVDTTETPAEGPFSGGLELEPAPSGDTLPQLELPEEPPLTSPPAEPDRFVLSDDLADFELELDLTEAPPSPLAQQAPQESKYSLEGVFRAFKQGVDSQLDKGDTETHYNLGIAYKEMGLYDDAVAEFKVAGSDPRRRLDCLTLQGLCYRDKGDMAAAEGALREGLALGDLSQEQSLALEYELGSLYEAMGEAERGRELFRGIYERAPNFRDVREKAGISGAGEEELPEPELLDAEMEELEQ